MPPDPGAKITGEANPPTESADIGHVAPSFETPKTFNTLVIRPDYRISLELGDIDALFPWPIDSFPGRLARLQVLGMLYFPLNHRCAAGSDTDPDSGLKRKPDVPKAKMAENREGYKVAWDYFKRKFCGVAGGDLHTDAADRKGEAELSKRLKEWVVQQMNGAAGGGPGGHLPKPAPLDDNDEPQPDETKGHFAKLRLPGGWTALSKNEIGEYTADQTMTGMHFYDSRFEHEWNCYKANPVLGLIPLVATVEKRDPATDEWKPADDVTVHFQFHKPYDLPAYDNGRKPHEQLNRPDLSGSSFSVTHPDPPNYVSGAGQKYFTEHWEKYQENADTPLVNNAHVDCGGKRVSGNPEDGSDVAAAGRNADEQRQKSLFWVGAYAGFTKKHDPPPAGYHNFKAKADASNGDALVAREIKPEPKWFKEAEPVNDADHPHCVKIKTNEEGKAGVIFLPSRAGGDRYRFRVYLADDGEGFESTGEDARAVRVETGTFVTWRHMRLTRVVQLGGVEAGMRTSAPGKLMAHQFHDSWGTAGLAANAAAISANHVRDYIKQFGVLNATTNAWVGLPAFDLDTVTTGALNAPYDGMRSAFARGFCELDTDPGAVGGFTNDEYKASAKQGFDDCRQYQTAITTDADIQALRLDVLFWRTQANPEQLNNITDGISEQQGFACPMRARKGYDDEANSRHGDAAKMAWGLGGADALWRKACNLVTGQYLQGFARRNSMNGFLPGMVVIQGAGCYSGEPENQVILYGIGIVNCNACYTTRGAAAFRDRIGKAIDNNKLDFATPARQMETCGFMKLVVHEMGHCLFRVHAPGLRGGAPASGVLLQRHDCFGHLTTEATNAAGRPLGEPRYDNCLMSYRNTDGLFCSRCLFEMRGWDIHGKMATKGIDPIPPNAVVGAPAGPVAPATAPAQVVNLKTVSGDKQVELTWDAAARAAGYEIRRATALGGPFNTGVANNIARLNHTDGGVANDTDYWYRVRARNSKGNGPWSAKVKAHPGTLPAPVNLQVAEIAGPKARLTWNAVAGATGYKVRYAFREGSYSNQPLNGASPFEIGVGAGQKLWFVVTAVKGAEESPYSNEVTLVIKPAAPANLQAKAADGKVELTWDTTRGADKYKIRRKESGGAYADLTEVGSGSTSHTDATAQAGKTYTYQMTASNDGGDSPNSNESTTTLKPAAPSLQPLEKGNLQLTVKWGAVDGATGYKLMRKQGAGAYAQAAAPAAGDTQYVDAGLTAGEKYTYKLLATNAAGDSKDSNEVDATMPPPAPTGLSAADQDGRVRLTWSAAAGADSYKLKRATTSGGPYQDVGSPGGTNYTDGTMEAGGTYYYVVTAVNSAGDESPNSNEANISLKPGRAMQPTLTPGSGKITVGIRAAKGAKRHSVKWGEAPGSYTDSRDVGPGVSSIDVNVRPNKTYYFIVVGTNDAGEGPASSPNSAMARE